MSLRESSKRKRNDEVIENEAPSKLLVSRTSKKQQYVAIRRGRSIRKCIFKSWEEAAEHLDGPACDVEYRMCGNIEEAAAFAFQEELEDERNVENELPSVSSINDFADDIMLMIFSFVCGSEKHRDGGMFADTGHFYQLLPGFGTASKLCKQRCLHYMQQVPLQYEDNGSPAVVARLSQLGVKLGDIDMLPDHSIDVSILLYMLKSCDVAHLRCFTLCLLNFNADKCKEELYAAKFKLDAIKCGIPYKTVHDGEQVGVSDFVSFFEDCSNKMISLRKLDMALHYDDFRVSMLQRCPRALVELSISLWEGAEEGEYDYSEVNKAIEKMPHLKKLDLKALTRTGTIRIKSQSLEELRCSGALTVAGCSCPSMKVLHIPSTMEWPVLRSCSQKLEEVFIKVPSFNGDVDDANRKLAGLSRLIERLPHLKKFKLCADIESDVRYKSTLKVRSSTLEELSSDFALGECFCPSLKALTDQTIMRIERLLSISSFEVIFTSLDILDLRFDGTVAEVDRGLDRLSAMIENMQMLKTLKLRSWNPVDLGTCSNPISLRSGTIEFIDIHGLEMMQCNCPLLKEFEIVLHSNGGADPMLQLEKFSEVVERMPKLEKLKVMGYRDDLNDYPIKIKSQSLVSLRAHVLSVVDCTFCPSLKEFKGNIPTEKEHYLSKEIEDLCLKVDNISPRDNLERLGDMVEQMPNLKKLFLKTYDRGELRINSRSLEEIDVTESNLGFMVTECICPSLQTFRVRNDAFVGPHNGVQLAASHDIRIENSDQSTFALSEFDFVGMEAPKSCVVKVHRYFESTV